MRYQFNKQLGCCILVSILFLTVSGKVGASDGLIHFNLARAYEAEAENIYRYYKRACMATDGVPEACLAWAQLAKKQDNHKDLKRALGSAVMLAPENIQARYELALLLLLKQDYQWAVEHLTAGISHAQALKNKALLQYYLGYAHYKMDEQAKALQSLTAASRHLDEPLLSRATFLRAKIEQSMGNTFSAYQLFIAVADAGDSIADVGEEESAKDAVAPESTLAVEAQKGIENMSVFPSLTGWGGQGLASLGFNSHPSAAFVDGEGEATGTALQSIFRADLMFGTDTGYAHRFKGSITLYREQNWLELGDNRDRTDPYSVSDMNLTLFMFQTNYVRRAFMGNWEHEIVGGVEGEIQFLDHLPITNDPNYPGMASASPRDFSSFSKSLGAKLGWSVSANPNSIWGARLKFEIRPNNLDDDNANRSAIRSRLRLVHTRYVAKRAVQLKFLMGGRYDRTYKDSTVIKYDRLVTEGQFDIKWRTFVPRLSLLGSILGKTNWYLNSDFNAANSFRPTFQNFPSAMPTDEAEAMKEYYSHPRLDLEWGLKAEAQVALWQKASLALRYEYKMRDSNIDHYPVPTDETGHRVAPTRFGYSQHKGFLELRQRF